MYPTFWAFWYNEVPKEITFYFRILSYKLLDYFSVSIITRTFFAPWKRDQVYLRNAPLNARLNVWLLNLISRLVGATLRAGLLLIYAATFLIGLLAFTLIILFWLLFPVVVLGLLILGIYYLAKGGSSGL
jgi:hypothetical protein